MSSVSSGWRLITAAQQAAWVSAAEGRPFINSLGQSITLSGQAYYVSVNLRRLAAGLGVIASPPLTPATAEDPAFTPTWTAGALSVAFTPPVDVGDVWQLWGGLPMGSAGGFAQRWTLLANRDDSTTSPYVATVPWVNTFGTPIAGQYSPLRARVTYPDGSTTSWFYAPVIIA